MGSSDTKKNETLPPPASKPERKRCTMPGCNKKIGLTAFACKCGGLYCGTHRSDQAHNCEHDYAAEGCKQLETRLIRVDRTKDNLAI